MAEPLYHKMLGLYLSLAEYRKAVQPGQTVYLWTPPNYERVQGIAGQGFSLTDKEPLLLFKYQDTLIQVTEENVFLFQPGSLTRK